jgi:hypothetical protein
VPDPALTIVSSSGLRGSGEDIHAVTLYELIALSKNPLYNRLLWLKLGEIENGLLKDDVNAFEEKKVYYREKLLRCIGMEECIEKKRPKPYWFVLTRFAPGDWGMTKIEPWPPAYEYFKEVLLPALFPVIINTPRGPRNRGRGIRNNPFARAEAPGYFMGAVFPLLCDGSST